MTADVAHDRNAGSAHGRHEAVDEAHAESTFNGYACPVRALASPGAASAGADAPGLPSRWS